MEIPQTASGTARDKEDKSFVKSPLRPNFTAKEVFVSNKVGISGDVGLLEGVQYDDIQASYPTPETEIYTYRLATVAVAQVEVTYTNSSKAVFLRARRL